MKQKTTISIFFKQLLTARIRQLPKIILRDGIDLEKMFIVQIFLESVIKFVVKKLKKKLTITVNCERYDGLLKKGKTHLPYLFFVRLKHLWFPIYRPKLVSLAPFIFQPNFETSFTNLRRIFQCNKKKMKSTCARTHRNQCSNPYVHMWRCNRLPKWWEIKTKCSKWPTEYTNQR